MASPERIGDLILRGFLVTLESILVFLEGTYIAVIFNRYHRGDRILGELKVGGDLGGSGALTANHLLPSALQQSAIDNC